ncbi:hepatoma-derived growth factor- protein [Homalodisca vitripennis]|nr:hepatoma-derived growth factor- protein [Homalodisca vitripennis]
MTVCPFNTGDIIFGKIKGIRHWPAKIIDIATNENKPPEFDILFFGDNTTATVKQSSLAPYLENIHTYGCPPTDSHRNEKFNLALKEAESAFYNQTPSVNRDTPTPDNGYSTMYTSAGTKILPTRNNSSIIELENSLLENDPTNDEDKLKMAATIGATLLKENNHLKKQVAVLESNLASNEAKMEDMKEEELKYLDKMEKLLVKLNETQAQLDKEKLEKSHNQSIFENHDQRQEALITDYTSEIKHLKHTISCLNTKMDKQKTKEPIPTKNIETQTVNNNLPSSSTIVLDMAEIKNQQNFIISKMNSSQNCTSKPCHAILKEASTQTERNQPVTPNVIYNSTNELNKIKLKQDEMERTIKLLEAQLRNLNPNISDSVKPQTNVCSISLQAARYRSLQQARRSPDTNPVSTLSRKSCGNKNFSTGSESLTTAKPSKVQVTEPKSDMQKANNQSLPSNNLIKRSPPQDAKIRKPEKSLEQFFADYIDHYKTKIGEWESGLKKGTAPNPQNFNSRSSTAKDDRSTQAGKIPQHKHSNSTKPSVRILHQNTQEVNNKINRLIHLLETLTPPPNIVIISEHGLKPYQIESVALIPRYRLIAHFSRERFRKGGVAIFVEEKLDEYAEAVDIFEYCEECV